MTINGVYTVGLETHFRPGFSDAPVHEHDYSEWVEDDYEDIRICKEPGCWASEWKYVIRIAPMREEVPWNYGDDKPASASMKEGGQPFPPDYESKVERLAQ